MKVTLINPPLVGVKNDVFGNIPSMPVGITYIAGYLRSKNIAVSIIDGFGEAPLKCTLIKNKYVRWGLRVEEIINKLDKDSDIVGISVHSVAQYTVTKEIISEIRRENAKTKIVVGGPVVTAIPNDFLNMGADYAVVGEGEVTFFDLIEAIKNKKSPPRLFNQKSFIENLDELPFPAIDLLPLEKYWKLNYAHGPVSGKYAFLITSRGCPFCCKFCASNTIWKKRWRARSAKNVFDEMIYLKRKYKIDEFHIQDEAPTIDRKRILELCDLIMKNKFKVKLKIVAGTKAETIRIEDLTLMKKAGFDYISMSPETGSRRVLNLMEKPFDYAHFNKLVKKCSELQIKTQACFVLGFPGETKADIKLSEKYVILLAKLGLDEIVVPIITPLPGAKIMEESKYEFQQYEDLTFSPTWRKDYLFLNEKRKKIMLKFLLTKGAYHPVKVVKMLLNVLRGKFDTKMEMTMHKILKEFINQHNIFKKT